MGKVKAAEIRDKTRADLLAQVEELKKELSQVRQRRCSVASRLVMWHQRFTLACAASSRAGYWRRSVQACQNQARSQEHCSCADCVEPVRIIPLG